MFRYCLGWTPEATSESVALPRPRSLGRCRTCAIPSTGDDVGGASASLRVGFARGICSGDAILAGLLSAADVPPTLPRAAGAGWASGRDVTGVEPARCLIETPTVKSQVRPSRASKNKNLRIPAPDQGRSMEGVNTSWMTQGISHFRSHPRPTPSSPPRSRK